MLGYDYIHDASLDQLKSWWVSPDTIPDEFEDGLDEVAYGLCRHCPGGVQFLRDDLRSGDLERRCASLFFLSTPDLADDDLKSALIDSFDSDYPRLSNTVLRSCLQLAYFPFDEHEIRRLWHHSDERFAATSMIYLARSLPGQTEAILTRALADVNPRMREYACDEVGDHSIAVLRPVLERLLDDPHPAVVASASCNLEFFANGSSSEN